MSQKSKTYNMRIRDALERGKPEIAADVRIERNTAYTNDLAKLSREFARQMTDGNYRLAQATLKTIVASSNKKIIGLDFEVKNG